MAEDHDAAAPRALPPAEAAPAERRRAIPALVLAIVVAAAAFGYAKGALDLRSESHHMLTQALAGVRQADAQLAAVDRVTRSGLTTDGGDAARAAYDPLLQAKKRLQDARDLIERAQNDARGSDRTFARALRQSAEGRLAMLEAASSSLPLQARASGALEDADAAWASVQRAAVLSDQAAQAFNTHSRTGVTSSTVLTQRAESELASAEVALQRAARAMPEASLKPLLDLVAERRRVAAESQRIDAVWLSGKVAEANTLLAKLVGEQTQAAARRGPLPKQAGDPLRAAYKKLAAAAVADYAKGRALAEEGDSRLQRLLGQPSE